MSERTNDTYITSKVKARFVEQNRFPATQVKVVTERGVVYLMGIVTRAEGEAAGAIAASTTGVQRVVKVFEYV
jgi:osmotically-inducible protein OsmY